MRLRMPVNNFPVRFPARMGGGRSGKFKILPILLFAGFVAFYILSNRSSVPITGRSQIVNLSREQEVALGYQSYLEVLNQSNVIENSPDLTRIRSIASRIANVIETEYTKGFEWEFNLIESDQVNAFCLPGGKVAVYTGLLPVAANDDGLAIVISHEIAHAVARHGAERMASQELQQLGTLAVGMSVGEMDPGIQRTVMGAFGIGTQFGIMLPFSRTHETEADKMGLIFAARACFNPEEAPRLWERMSQASEGSVPEFLSTHPNSETRIENFKLWMPEAIKIRQQRCN